MNKHTTGARIRRAGITLFSAIFAIGLYAALPARAAGVITTHSEAEAALAELTSEQQVELAQWLENVLQNVNFGQFFQGYAAPTASPLNMSLTSILATQTAALGTALGVPDEVMNLLPEALRYEWQTTSGGVTRTHQAVFNVPNFLDVDDVAGADVMATLSITGTSGVTLTVDKVGSVGGVGLGLAALPLKIEAIVSDPRGGSARFAFGYDSLGTDAPTQYSESVTISGTGQNTTIAVNVSQSGAGQTLSLTAEEFTGSATQRSPAQTVGVNLTPVPASLDAAVSLGSTISANFGAASATRAAIDYVTYGAAGAQPIALTIDSLPTSLAITVAQSSGTTQLTYNASSTVGEISAEASNLTSFGAMKILQLDLASIPTSMNLQLGGDGGEFDLNTNGADLGLLEVALSSGPIETLPAEFDGALLKTLPDRSLLSARIHGLRRISGTQSPMSILLDSTAARKFKVDLREQASVGAKQTYTVAELSSLARNTQVAIQDGSKQVITYSADTATGVLSFDTNAGNRNYMNADVAPVPASIYICAAGNNSCSTSGKAGNTASFRVVSSQHMTANLYDCQNSSCSERLQMSDVNIRLADFTVNVGQNCANIWPFGKVCEPQGSKGSLWLDTDNHSLRGTINSQSSSFKVKAGFGNGFRANNRYVSWSHFIPSKSGSVSCTSGTYLDVTVFGVTIDIAWLYLC